MLNGAQGCRMVSPDSTKDNKGKWNEVYYSQILEEELEEEVKARVQAQKKGRMRGICLYYGPKVEYFEVPWLRPDSNQKMQNFGMLPKSSFFFFPKGVQGKGPPWETGVTVYNKNIWGIMSESYIYLWLLGCYLGYVFRGGVNISLRSLQIRDW